MTQGNLPLHIYVLRSGWEEGITTEHILEGPPMEDFQALCDSLLDEAARRDIERSKARYAKSHLEYQGTFVSPDGVVDHIAELLVEKHGFHPVAEHEASYTHSGIEEKCTVARDTNQAYHERRNREYEKKKGRAE